MIAFKGRRDSCPGRIQLHQGGVNGHHHRRLHLSPMKIPHISRADGGLHIRVAEGSGRQDKGQEAKVTAKFPAQHLDNGGIASMAHQKGQFFKTVMGQAGSNIVQHVVVGIRLKGDGAAEILMFRTKANRDGGENQHRKIGIRCQQFLFQIAGHGFRNQAVRSQRSLISMLLQRPQGNQHNGVFPVNLFHLQSGQLPVILNHRRPSLHCPKSGRNRVKPLIEKISDQVIDSQLQNIKRYGGQNNESGQIRYGRIHRRHHPHHLV